MEILRIEVLEHRRKRRTFGPAGVASNHPLRSSTTTAKAASNIGVIATIRDNPASFEGGIADSADSAAGHHLQLLVLQCAKLDGRIAQSSAVLVEGRRNIGLGRVHGSISSERVSVQL
jgi:hypothetical protein